MERRHLLRDRVSRATVAIVVMLLLLTPLAGDLQAQQDKSPGATPTPLSAMVVAAPHIGNAKEPGTPKLQGDLDRLVEAYDKGGWLGLEEAAAQRNIKLHDGRVLIVIEGDVQILPDQLTKLGGDVDSIAHDRLSLLAPVSALRDMAALPGTKYVRLPLPAMALDVPLVGSVTSEGVAVIDADNWHTAGYDGTGVTVGAVDFGFYNWQSSLQGSGDLPAGSNTVCMDYTTGSNCGNADTSQQHGSACAEILYDVAPGVDTMYLYAFDDDADIASIVTHMIANGVDVASMSIGWVNGEPYDGSGPISTEVNRAKTNGDIFFATSSGNQRQRHYEATYGQGDCSVYHDFDTSSSCANLNGLGLQSAGDLVCTFLEWNDWPLTDQDYDLLIYRYNSGNPAFVWGFWSTQDGDDPPVEGGCFNAPTTDYYYFAVDQYSATSDHYFEVFAWYDNFGIQTNESSLTEPATADGAVAVAAFDYSTPTTLESFSSEGPRNPSGGGAYNPSACGASPTAECKPDFAGPDYVSTVSYGAGNFPGTSAASPHVAGAAALVKDAYPAYTSDQIYANLQTRAPNPGTFGLLSTSMDSAWGWGRIQMGATPTAVGLATFSAEAAPDGSAILLQWETASEVDNLGFNVYRQAAEGERVRLNAALIPSQNPGSSTGEAYTWADDSARPGVTYFYWLEDVDVTGATSLHGPISAELLPMSRLLPVRPRLVPEPPSIRR